MIDGSQIKNFSNPTGTGFLREDGTYQPVSSSPPNWHGKIYGAYGSCDPGFLIRLVQTAGTVAATPTNIGTSVARCALFKPPANLVLNNIRYYGVGATTNIYRVAIYNVTTGARVTNELPFTTAATTFGSIAAGGITLTAGQLYSLACSVNATGTVAGLACMGPTVAATTGMIGVLPTSWPGNLDVDLGYIDEGFFQFAVTTGALPATLPTLVAQSAWTGGFPAFWLDNA